MVGSLAAGSPPRGGLRYDAGAMNRKTPVPAPGPVAPAWLGAAAWALAWLTMILLDGRVDLASQVLLLVLAAALASLSWRFAPSLLVSALSVLTFNVSFVPPRGRFAVDLHQHALLLLTMLIVSWIVTALVSRLRAAIAAARAHARRSDELRALGDTLRQAGSADEAARALLPLLDAASCDGAGALLLRRPGASVTPGVPIGHDAHDAHDDVQDTGWHLLAPATPDEQSGMRAACREGKALGAGTGRFETVPGLYLPLRGARDPLGAALIRTGSSGPLAADERAHLQALCDLVGAAVERAATEAAAREALEASQLQALRNTLLSAVAHDYRMPLATIVSAAGALREQAQRLQPAQIGRLAGTIVDEALQLSRIADNTLQLARLDALGSAIPKEWESAEELVGTVVRRVRQRAPGAVLRVSVETGLPLLRCDAVLIVQLLDNLVDNALKFAGGAGPVTLFAHHEGSVVALGVEDHGPGIPPADRLRVFERFAHGPDVERGRSPGPRPIRGVGVGLALCKAIAQAHEAGLTIEDASGGGARVVLRLPVPDPCPPAPPR